MSVQPFQNNPLDHINPSTSVDLADWVAAAAEAEKLMQGLVDSFFIPETYRTAGRGDQGRIVAIANGVGAILLGKSLGVDPLTALRNIYVIKGRTGMYSAFKAAIAASHGHEMWVVENTDDVATVRGRRKGWPADREVSVTITIGMAEKAGWFTNSNYKTTPADMLYARALGRVADRIAGPELFGIPSAEDLQDLPEDQPAQVKVTAADIRREPKQLPPAGADHIAADHINQQAEARRKQAAAEESRALEQLSADSAAARAALEQLADEVVAREREQLEADALRAENEQRVPMISTKQSRQLFALLRGIGAGEAADGLKVVGYAAGREVTSTKTLTEAEAGTVIGKLVELSDMPPAQRRATVHLVLTGEHLQPSDEDLEPSDDEIARDGGDQ